MTKVKAEMEASEVKEVSNETRFSLYVLRANCLKLYGITSSTFAGATADLADSDYTIAEVKKIIDNWLKKEVK